MKHKFEGIDFSGCSMKGTVLQSAIFRRCKFNTELLNSATIENSFFSGCYFEGKRLSTSLLDNVRFFPEYDIKGLVYESTRRLSRILYESCVNQNNEFNLKQWLEVMGKSNCLRVCSTPLDDLSRDILSQHIEEIKRKYPQQLCEIIYALFSIEFKTTANAINFVCSNPEFYQRPIKDLKDLYFEFRTIFLKEGDYGNSSGDPFNELCAHYTLGRTDFSREAVLALMLNVINLVLFPESNDQYIDFGVNANSADEHDDCLKAISEVSSESAQKNSIASLKTGSLPLVEMQRYKAHLCRFYLSEYRKYFHRFWKECSEKSQLTIAKHCLRHQNVAVSPLTTEEFITLLSKDHDVEIWRDMYNANMEKHTKIQKEWDLLRP
ncbi:pentapeptide repeat-containing protein [Endozoicomonas sp. ISHI1]|uniref:pentapeptide repeat-containing protein n=1 Tax=Endozoicomonas sp. ISHI1 TaxID=2825882 RepID=UPI0021476A5D|nr:pentapeptide repeat-containing protein [Endozoicomonas sp. ISHI1]